MKCIFILFAIALLPCGFANAQFLKNNALYLSSELGSGSFYGGGADLNYVLKDKYSFKLGFSGGMRRAKTRPEDYSEGILTSIFTLGMTKPKDMIEGFGLSAGRIYKLNQSGTIRLNMSLGVYYTTITEPENWEKIKEMTFPIFENYSYD